MLVSVIITTYNRSDLLCRAIESVLRQTYEMLEIIVVDDCSSDNTEQLVKKNYNHIVKYIRTKKNLGLSAARNTGIQKALGNYISFLDDDDELMPQKIEKQMALFNRNSKVDAVYCGSIRKYKNIEIENLPKDKGNIYKTALRACPNAIHTLMIKKTCFERTGLFDKKFKAFEDWDMWIRLARYYQFDYVPEALVIYNFHGRQMSVELDLKITAAKKILDKHFNELEKSKKALHWHYRKLVNRCALAGRYSEGFMYITHAVKAYPFNVSSYIHILLMLMCRPLHRKLIYKYGLLKIGDIYIL